jgi:hypothetical protein
VATGLHLPQTAMPRRTCPKCHRKGRFLALASAGTQVEYYRCDHCAHVWSYDVDNPESSPKDITHRKPNDS